MSLADRLNGLFAKQVSPRLGAVVQTILQWGQLGLRCPSGHRKYRSRAPVIVGSNPTRPTNMHGRLLLNDSMTYLGWIGLLGLSACRNGISSDDALRGIL